MGKEEFLRSAYGFTSERLGRDEGKDSEEGRRIWSRCQTTGSTRETRTKDLSLEIPNEDEVPFTQPADKEGIQGSHIGRQHEEPGKTAVETQEAGHNHTSEAETGQGRGRDT